MSIAKVLSLAVAASMLAACAEDDPTATSTEHPTPRWTIHTLSQDSIVEDPTMLEIARRIPDFAGYYLNARGEIEVAMTDLARSAEAVENVRRKLGAHPAAARSIPLRQVRFSFLDLARYRTVLGQHVFGIPGVTSLSVGESANRVKISVNAPRAEAEVQRLLRTLDIPEDAVVIWYAGFARDAAELTDPHPQSLVEGAWMIQSDAASCTLGFAAIAPNGVESFVINSHCTATPWGFDGGHIRQPFVSTGQESRDPPTWNCSWTGQNCRHSDAALVTATRTLAFGRIARTTQSSNCEDCAMPLTVHPTSPALEITGSRDGVLENEVLHKIGKTTGWTYGAVEGTCEDWAPSGGFWLVKRLCSDRIDYSSRQGDSGAPVFALNGNGTITLVGIHWGFVLHDYPDPWNDGIMSSLRQVKLDLGSPLAVYDSGPPTFVIEGPTVVRPSQRCTWSAQGIGIPIIDNFQWSGALSGSGYSITGSLQNSGVLTVSAVDGWARQGSASIYVQVDPYLEDKACLGS